MTMRMTVDTRKRNKEYIDMIKFFSLIVTVILFVFCTIVYLLVSEPIVGIKTSEDTYMFQDYTVTTDVMLRQNQTFKLQLTSPLRDNYYFEYPSLLNDDWCFYVKQKQVDLDGFADLITFEEA